MGYDRERGERDEILLIEYNMHMIADLYTLAHIKGKAPSKNAH